MLYRAKLQRMMRRNTAIVSVLLFASVFAVYCTYVMSFFGGKPDVNLPKIKLLEKISAPPGVADDLRLLFVGDVHGQYEEMMQLFAKTGLDNTTVVLLGDFLVKGPESVRVADYILEHKDQVKCILGNHDLAVMFAFLNPSVGKFPWYGKRHHMKPLEFTLSNEVFYPRDMSKLKRMHWQVARELGPERINSLAQHCSAAMHFDLGTKKLYAVHAGILPGDFEEKMPSVQTLSEMRYVDRGNWDKNSKDKVNKHYMRWYKLWKGSKLPEKLSTTYVLYGHDAAKGLNMRGHTLGLDTGCVKGGELSGLEFKRKDGGDVITQLHQVRCNGARRMALKAIEQDEARRAGQDTPDEPTSMS